jgi:hypothetical protein
MPVEQFLGSLRFEIKGKIDDLGVDLNLISKKQISSGLSLVPELFTL